ncbi:choline kinase family protein [Raineyella sp. LH-20]|uniref:choline kinase family protein n=1 Tax=Raineyella sp. LH-20 TaxID=3081204 RepID=UPI0029550353|nr:phosphotransferase [Raineyella sp. LH-20]WOP17740.1 phosphotransferase [Raineyella sp. LH-20]
MTESAQAEAAAPHAVATGRRVGDARTPEERRVEEAIAAIAEWRSAEVSFCPVSGGISNSNWRIDVVGDPVAYFLKIPGEGSEEYIDRVNSHEAARRAGAMGIGPRVVHVDSETGVEVIEFLEGYRACTNADLKNIDIARRIIGRHREFQASGLLPHTKTVFDTIDGYVQQIHTLGVRLPNFAGRVLAEYASARDAFMASGLDIVPCHNDPMPGNFLVAEGRPLRMIDFEFAANNERAYELAVMTTEFFYDEPTLLACVEELYGETSWKTVARVRVAGAMADVNWGLWAFLKRQYDTSTFDYYKYGAWKLDRARATMNDVRWGQWLHSL